MGAWRWSSVLWLLATVGSLALLALYVDWKRRKDPDFARRLRESLIVDLLNHISFMSLDQRKIIAKRRKEKKKTEDDESKFLELKDSAGVEEYFLRELQLGERFMELGHYKKSIEHLNNAIAVCIQPSQLMDVFEETLPPHVFEMLARKIQQVTEQLQTTLNEQATTKK